MDQNLDSSAARLVNMMIQKIHVSFSTDYSLMVWKKHVVGCAALPCALGDGYLNEEEGATDRKNKLEEIERRKGSEEKGGRQS